MTVHRLLNAASPLLIDLAQVIGQEAVVTLCEAFGGTRVYVPRQIAPAHPIGRILSAPVAKALAEHYHGTMLDLPKAYVRRERAVELVRSGEMSLKDVARAVDYSERHLRRIVNAPDDSEQLDLPF